MLNLINASRLFYADALPETLQDNKAWCEAHDPDSCLAYEGLRHHSLDDSRKQPYATGDAMRNGRPSNIGLYGSSHIGYMAAVAGEDQCGRSIAAGLPCGGLLRRECISNLSLFQSTRARGFGRDRNRGWNRGYIRHGESGFSETRRSRPNRVPDRSGHGARYRVDSIGRQRDHTKRGRCLWVALWLIFARRLRARWRGNREIFKTLKCSVSIIIYLLNSCVS